MQRANQETGGSVIELGEASTWSARPGLPQALDDFRKIPVFTSEAGVPVRLADVARIQIGPETRRGIAELTAKARSSAASS